MKDTMPRWCLFGKSEIWRPDGTATIDWYGFGIRVWRRNFTHSTLWID